MIPCTTIDPDDWRDMLATSRMFDHITGGRDTVKRPGVCWDPCPYRRPERKACSRFDVSGWLNFGAPELDFSGGGGDGAEELEWGTCQERENQQ